MDQESLASRRQAHEAIPDPEDLELRMMALFMAIKRGLSPQEVLLTSERWELGRRFVQAVLSRLEPSDLGRAMLTMRQRLERNLDYESPEIRGLVNQAVLDIVSTSRMLQAERVRNGVPQVAMLGANRWEERRNPPPRRSQPIPNPTRDSWSKGGDTLTIKGPHQSNQSSLSNSWNSANDK